MEKDSRIIGKVFNVYDTQEAEKYVGSKGFFLDDDFYLRNLDNCAGIRIGTLLAVKPATNYPYNIDGSPCDYSFFIPESHVNTILRPCSNEKYETTNEDTIKWFTTVTDAYFDDIVKYGEDLIYKYHVLSKQMLVTANNSNHVWCNFTIRDWRELHKKEY